MYFYYQESPLALSQHREIKDVPGYIAKVRTKANGFETPKKEYSVL